MMNLVVCGIFVVLSCSHLHSSELIHSLGHLQQNLEELSKLIKPGGQSENKSKMEVRLDSALNALANVSRKLDEMDINEEASKGLSEYFWKSNLFEDDLQALGFDYFKVDEDFNAAKRKGFVTVEGTSTAWNDLVKKIEDKWNAIEKLRNEPKKGGGVGQSGVVRGKILSFEEQINKKIESLKKTAKEIMPKDPKEREAKINALIDEALKDSNETIDDKDREEFHKMRPGHQPNFSKATGKKWKAFKKLYEAIEWHFIRELAK